MKQKYPRVYAFVDSQNLNYGTCKNIYSKKKKLIYRGWKLDFAKFRIYLKDKFGVRSEIDFYINSDEELIITTDIQKSIVKLNN